MKQLHVCIIGAGAAGLSAAKNALNHGMEVTVFEQAKSVGGTWVYTEDIGKDRYGLDIHTSMYKGLKTNLPKELMGYPDFPIPSQDDSFISAEDMLSFLKSYAKHFNIIENIKFEHHVLRIRPLDDIKWEVIVKDLPNDRYDTLHFDAVLVCNGHYNTPSYPDVKGQELFRGKQFHSHDFRCADSFKDETILVIGAGPSGIDVAYETSKFAKRVSLSHHLKENPTTTFPENLNFKPDVKCIREKSVQFVDGSVEEYSVIFYCTGYKYAFPFLSVDCDITTDGNYVRPLYKHIININRPTMAFIGLPFNVCASQMFDLQTRFFLKFLTGQKELPSRPEMLKDTNREMEARWARGLTRRQAHMMGDEQGSYYEELATTADIEPLKPVIPKIYAASTGKYLHKNFRNDRYEIVDDENFVKIKS